MADAPGSIPSPSPPSGGGAPTPQPGVSKPGGGGSAKRSWQAPKGTRDFYPTDLLRRRYIIDSWRRTALRHGFEEIDGPTFEDAELYTVKSGEGILGELFGAFSGKSPEEVEQVKSGRPPFALRPEFTPTLARMYAAKAKQVVQPTKWFCVSNFFRAERPQRGRLREFWQWNVDALGDETALADADVIGAVVELLIDLGVGSESAAVRLGHRAEVETFLIQQGVPTEHLPRYFDLIDLARKIDRCSLAEKGEQAGLNPKVIRRAGIYLGLHTAVLQDEDPAETSVAMEPTGQLRDVFRACGAARLDQFCKLDYSIVRGLAYYTGTVFELIAEGERAVAGGGRYDKLIELFGGPPTPAVGFGMGDVVLTNLLDDRKLMPEGRDLLEACARPLPMRCDVFVIANEKEESQAQVVPLVAKLRRGVESQPYNDSQASDDFAKRMKPWSPDRYAVAPLHARRSYKTTRNIGKLLGDATACHARFACIIENAETCTLKNLDTREETKDIPIAEVGASIARQGR